MADGWQVTAQVHRTVKDARGQEWQSSRQVPTFVIPAWSGIRADVDAKVRDILNPWGDPGIGITMDVLALDSSDERPIGESQLTSDEWPI